MAKDKGPSLGQVIIYGNPNYRHDPERNAWLPENRDDKTPTVEIMDIQEIDREYIRTSRYVLPLKDATIHTSDEGLVYSYNGSLPYLAEVAHLAEVEKNIIMQQAFLYQGRTAPAKTPIMMILLVALLGLLAVIGMFK